MTRDELISQLKPSEWSDIAFKVAAWSVPEDASPTVTEAGMVLKLAHEQQQASDGAEPS